MICEINKEFALFARNPVVLACASSWFCAQIIKTIRAVCKREIHSIKDFIERFFWRTGGLPSSHTALVSTLSAMFGIKNGFSSDSFILSFSLCIITIRDAVGVRRSNGIQAAVINRIGRKLKENDLMNYKPIKEIQGHSPLEVFLGAGLGLFVACIFGLFL